MMDKELAWNYPDKEDKEELAYYLDHSSQLYDTVLFGDQYVTYLGIDEDKQQLKLGTVLH